MTLRPCTHGFPKPSNCWDCMEDGNIEPPPPEQQSKPTDYTFTAKFDGHCDGCNLGIHPGQLITRIGDGTYQHDDCSYR